MKRTYLAKHNALLSRASLSWGSAALALALLALFMRLVTPNALDTVVAPAFKLSHIIGNSSHSFFSSFSDAAALATENQALREQNLALSAENQALVDKSASLESLLGGRGAPMQGIVAGVIAHPPESPYDSYLVGMGSDDGVVLNMEAFGAGGVPLGIVTAVEAHFARITLFSAPDSKTAGWIGKAKVPLVLLGAGAGTFQAFAARAASITVGDSVYLPGPGALPVGSVVRIDSDPSSPTVSLRIQPALNLFSQTWIELRDVGNAAANAFSLATSTPL